jgi:hypothetical protein
VLVSARQAESAPYLPNDDHDDISLAAAAFATFSSEKKSPRFKDVQSVCSPRHLSSYLLLLVLFLLSTSPALSTPANPTLHSFPAPECRVCSLLAYR